MKKILVLSCVLLALCATVFFLSRKVASPDPRGDGYAVSVTCQKCHSDIYASYLHTAHFSASAPATPASVHGSFSAGRNVVVVDDSQKVVMEKADSGLFQAYYVKGKVVQRQRFDIVLGGVKGESYLYWSGNGLNQLPVSWYTKEDKWMLSPRFDPRKVDFHRSIGTRCFECHAGYIGDQADASQQQNAAEQFDRGSLVYRIDCERCHGPGARHAAFQADHPEIKTASFIARVSSLPRARRMDVCGVCHSGNKGVMLRSTFWFQPGDTLSKFKLADFFSVVDSNRLDVHGNQMQLLERSKCYMNSNMDCATCHDTHRNQRGSTETFIQKCLGCHSPQGHNYCKMANSSNAAMIQSNCIQCHMPALPSMAIVSANLSNRMSSEILVHTHHIALYPQEVKKVLALFLKN